MRSIELVVEQISCLVRPAQPTEAVLLCRQ